MKEIYKGLIVPDTLPNNLKAIRLMSGKDIKDVADALEINPIFLSTVENQKNNLSGKTTLRVLKYFNITFNELYDVGKTLELVHTKEYSGNITFDIIMDKELVDDNFYINPKVKDIIDNHIAYLHSHDNKKDDIVYHTKKYEILNQVYKDNKAHLNIKADFIKKVPSLETFDINFFKETDVELTNILVNKGFYSPYEVVLSKNDFEVDYENNVINLNKEYIYYDSEEDKYIASDKININNSNINIIKDDNYNAIAVKFISFEETINNIEFIMNFLKENRNINYDNIWELLGLTYNGYINLIRGNQKISTKIMWKLVKLFKVPLELIINIDLYIKKFGI